MQPTTQAVLINRDRFTTPPPVAAICERTAAWLVDSLPGFRWRELTEDEKKAAKLPEPVNQLLICATHWIALHLPSALNTSWQIKANTLNLDSYLRLSGDYVPEGALTIDLDPSMFGVKDIKPTKQMLDECASLVHRWGDTSRALGGEKSRAKELSKELCSLHSPVPGTAAAMLRLWVEHECDLMLSGGEKAIEVSTLSTYLSHLKSSLEQISPVDDPRTWGDEEWGRFLVSVEGSTPSRGNTPEARAQTKAAAEQRLVSARRFLRSLKHRGYPIPEERLLPAARTIAAPVQHPSAGVWIGEQDAQAAGDLVLRALVDFPVLQSAARTL